MAISIAVAVACCYYTSPAVNQSRGIAVGGRIYIDVCVHTRMCVRAHAHVHIILLQSPTISLIRQRLWRKNENNAPPIKDWYAAGLYRHVTSYDLFARQLYLMKSERDVDFNSNLLANNNAGGKYSSNES